MNGSLKLASSEGTEEAFVVLNRHLDEECSEQGSSNEESLINSSLVCPTISNVPNTDAMSQATSIMSSSVTSELSAAEIQSKLESLLQENLQLKATLQQNNMAIKKQFSTLEMWQEDVMKIHQSQKETFEETKKLISNLGTENAELEKSNWLPCATNTNKSSEDEILTLKSKISALQFELDTLRQENIKFKDEQCKIIQELEFKLTESEKIKAEVVTKLQTQVDDFNREREAKNTLKTERDRLAEDLQHLQRRNYKLLEKVEHLSPQEFVHTPSAPLQQQQQQDSRETVDKENDTPKEEDPTPKETVPLHDTWNCNFCTYLNSSEMEICAMCEKRRRAGSEAPLAVGGPQCHRCTFVNQREAKKCELCDACLHNSPTYI